MPRLQHLLAIGRLRQFGVACDHIIRVLDPANGNKKQSLEGHTDWVYSFAIAADGKTLASGSWDGEVRTWTLSDGKPLRTFVAAPGSKPKAQTAAK